MSTDATKMYDVIIAGYGPVGATLGNMLGQRGLRVAILEREAGVYHLARAGHMDAEVMRVFQGIGVADTLEPKTGITRGMRFLDADGTLLMEWKRGGDKGPLGWVSDYMFHQPTLEGILRDQLAEIKNVQTFLSHDAYTIEQDAESVVVKAEDTVNSRLVEFRGRYLVGCDGARSLTRRTMASEYEDLGFKQRWLVVDAELRGDVELEMVSIQHCNPERPMYASCTTGGMLRWEIMILPDDDIGKMTRHDAVWDFIENSVRPIRREDGELTRVAAYTFESLIAERWRQGRFLIAGDAAHRMPPFLGQGMCAGIRDAANLGWKLAAVCEGRADDGLLDTYAAERRSHVREFTEGAVEAGRIIQMSDPDELAERVRDMRANPKDYSPPNPALGTGLSADYGRHGLGRQFAQPRIGGVLLDDIIGSNFALVGSEAYFRRVGARDLAGQYPALRCVVLPRECEALLQPYGAGAVLLRPDRYVHAAVDAEQDTAAALAPLAGLLR